MSSVCFVVTGGDAELTEEAVQSAWPIAWRKLHTIRDPECLRPWLISIAVNEARQLSRMRPSRACDEITVVDRVVGWPATISPPTSAMRPSWRSQPARRTDEPRWPCCRASRADMQSHQGSISIESTTPWSSARFFAELPGWCLATTTSRLPATSTTYTESVLPGEAQQSPSLRSGPGAGQ